MKNRASTVAASSAKRDVGNAWQRPAENTRVEDKPFKCSILNPVEFLFHRVFYLKAVPLKSGSPYKTVQVNKINKLHGLVVTSTERIL